MQYDRYRRRTVGPLLLSLLLAGLGGCDVAGAALGETPPLARANADGLLYAIGARFGPRRPEPGFAEARARFSRSALVPSRIHDDPELWTASRGDDVRLYEIAGRPAGTGYRLGIRGAGPPPRALGESRRAMRLERLSGGQFEWTVRDELAVGRVSPDELGASLAALFRAAERHDPAAARAAYRAALPASTAALGRLFSLDSLALSPPAARGGGTDVHLVMSLNPDGVANELPELARYLRRYAGPFRFEMVVEGPDGVRWWTAGKQGDRMTLRLRVHDGALVPLDGPPRRIPDRVRVRVDVATRIRIFNVGASGLVGDVALVRRPDEKSFTTRFAAEPDWHLPLLAERLIRTPLRRPFAGDGATFGMSARAGDDTTLLVRDYRLAVQESAILRWFGGLGSTAMGDFRRGADEQFRSFVGEVFTALRSDASTLIR